MLFQVWTRAERQAAATGRGVSRGWRFQQFPWRGQWGRFRFQFRRWRRRRERRFLDQRGCVGDGGVHGYQVSSEGPCDRAYIGRTSPYYTVLRAPTSSAQIPLSRVSFIYYNSYKPAHHVIQHVSKKRERCKLQISNICFKKGKGKGHVILSILLAVLIWKFYKFCYSWIC